MLRSQHKGGAQVFGNSPDETAYFRIALNRESVGDALLAIQPSLLAYQLEQPVQVRCDPLSLRCTAASAAMAALMLLLLACWLGGILWCQRGSPVGQTRNKAATHPGARRRPPCCSRWSAVGAPSWLQSSAWAHHPLCTQAHPNINCARKLGPIITLGPRFAHSRCCWMWPASTQTLSCCPTPASCCALDLGLNPD